MGELVRLACGAFLLLRQGARTGADFVAAVERLADRDSGVLAEAGRRVAVLAELPDESENRIAGRALAPLVDEIVAVGGAGARALLESAREAGLPSGSTRLLPTPESAIEMIRERLGPADRILLAGPEGCGLDRAALAFERAGGDG